MFKPLFQQTVTLNRVFDIQRWGQSKYQPAHTTFGFSAEGKSHYCVVVPGFPTVEAGTTVTALLREPGNWMTVFGWINDDTKEIAAPDAGWQLGNALTSAFIAALSALFTFGSGSTISSTFGLYAGAGVCLLMALLSGQFFVKYVRNLSYSKQLKSLSSK